MGVSHPVLSRAVSQQTHKFMFHFTKQVFVRPNQAMFGGDCVDHALADRYSCAANTFEHGLIATCHLMIAELDY